LVNENLIMHFFITEILDQFESISLADLNDYKLLNRIDTKYICNLSVLPEILNKAKPYFKVQAINNERSFKYESLYFDTKDLKTYFDHHQGKRIRYKIRFRNYLDTGDTFLEIKKKKNFNRTIKQRDEFEFSNSLNQNHQRFISKVIEMPESGFKPTIWTKFNRITLAGKNHIERVTIDRNISFSDEQNQNEIEVPNMVIIEVKRNKSGDVSPFTKILKDLRIRPFGISKYVLGNILINPELKHNRFNKKISTINKISYDN